MRLVIQVAAAVFVLDQALKYYVVHWLGLARLGAIDVLPPFLNLRMAWNTGINFGLFAGGSETARWVLIVVALAITAAVTVWMWREPPGVAGRVSAGLLVGGALGNVVDRVLYGAVADFLNMSCCGIENPYAFNVADIAIFAGALGLVFFTGGDGRRDTKKAP
ncbi:MULTISPECIES: signal peptidase II [unclassified Rhodosalinus]|uniref:signal peptidase II n=1 Tax=unclassified Rhodosalinus TaxID=2630183 RepID=UPI003524AEA7